MGATAARLAWRLQKRAAAGTGHVDLGPQPPHNRHFPRVECMRSIHPHAALRPCPAGHVEHGGLHPAGPEKHEHVSRVRGVPATPVQTIAGGTILSAADLHATYTYIVSNTQPACVLDFTLRIPDRPTCRLIFRLEFRSTYCTGFYTFNSISCRGLVACASCHGGRDTCGRIYI